MHRRTPWIALLMVAALSTRCGPGDLSSLAPEGLSNGGERVTVAAPGERVPPWIAPVAAPPPAPRGPVLDPGASPRPAVTAAPRVLAQVPCLDYDGVSDKPTADPYVVTTAAYKQQMQWLADRGFTVMTLRALLAALKDPATLPERPVLLFSDTTSSWFQTLARPILDAHGFKATLGVELELLGKKSWAMGAADLLALQQAGFEVASHSASHADLRTLSPAALTKEVSGTLQALSALGLQVDSFVYPYGAYNDAVVKAVKAAGYSAARATGAKDLSGGGYSALDPRRRFRLNCALPTASTTTQQLADYLYNRRLELEDLFVVEKDAGSLATISRSNDFSLDSYGAVYMGDAGDSVSVAFHVGRAGRYRLDLRVKTGYDGAPLATTSDYRYTLGPSPLPYTTVAGSAVVEQKWVAWGTHRLAPAQLPAGWVTLTVACLKDWSCLLDQMEITYLGQ